MIDFPWRLEIASLRKDRSLAMTSMLVSKALGFAASQTTLLAQPDLRENFVPGRGSGSAIPATRSSPLHPPTILNRQDLGKEKIAI